ALYCILPDGDIDVYNVFNSPLSDGSIRRLALDPDEGYLYITTGRGLWRADLGVGLSTPGSQGPTLYPNPFLPALHGAARLAGMPDDPTVVRVFDLSGELVYESQTPDRDSFLWSGVDSNGDPLASGTYIVSIDQGGQPCLFKIAIVR
ncbi:T9SS type A sorting domain-containing protein, partial [Candidatus Fermentibacterales bacterium]|nr:T9SS type A sorting domain-containing protein [Candidatus Fermentibacterales bacterium]